MPNLHQTCFKKDFRIKLPFQTQKNYIGIRKMIAHNQINFNDGYFFIKKNQHYDGSTCHNYTKDWL